MYKFSLIKSPRKNKRFRALFVSDKNDIRYTDFGQKGGSTFIDHFDKQKRKNYIARHSKLNENWNSPFTPGSLSRWILWEDPDLDAAIDNFKKRFKLT